MSTVKKKRLIYQDAILKINVNRLDENRRNRLDEHSIFRYMLLYELMHLFLEKKKHFRRLKLDDPKLYYFTLRAFITNRRPTFAAEVVLLLKLLLNCFRIRSANRSKNNFYDITLVNS